MLRVKRSVPCAPNTASSPQNSHLYLRASGSTPSASIPPCALLCSGLRRSEQHPDLANLCSHGPARLYVFVGPDPMLEITVAVAPGPARASCPTMHSAPCPTSNRCLSTGVTGSRSRSTATGSGHIREPSFCVGLTHGVVCHSRPPPSRSSGGFIIPTTPCAPECMWTCRTSTVCLLPRR
jgi:hypothetical protein